jgi:multidrug efflux system membrane fusion protein
MPSPFVPKLTSAVVSIGIILLVLGGWLWWNRKQTQVGEGTQPAKPLPVVGVAIPLKEVIVEWDDFVGRLEAIDSADVRSRLSGYLATTSFVEGQEVKAGDILATIDSRPYLSEVARTEGDLAEANAVVKQAEASVLQASSEAERSSALRSLAEKQVARIKALRQQNAVSQEELDIAEATYLETLAGEKVAKSKIIAAEANLLAAQAGEKVAQSNVDIAKLNLKYTTILAPIDGLISRRYVTEGNMVSGGTSESTLITNIVSLDPIHCYFDVDEQTYLKYMRLAREGKRAGSRDARNPVYLSLADDRDNYRYTGHIDFVDNRFDKQTGTIRGRAILRNESKELAAGMFARIRVPGSAPYEAVLIPDKAVGTDQSEKFVYVVNRMNVVEKRRVVLGPISHGLRIVREGLDGSERVIVTGMQRAKDKMTVAVSEKTEKVERVADGLPDEFEPIPFDAAIIHERRPAGNIESREKSDESKSTMPGIPSENRIPAESGIRGPAQER